MAWLKVETKQANPALAAAVETSGDADLAQALAWSKAVNETIARLVRGVPPFPFVRDCLEKLQGRADVLVVSATPNEALEREWEEHGLDKYVAAICGQEIGTKKETLGVAKKYAADHTLMIGDAPGIIRRQSPTRPCSFRSIRGPKKPVGGGCSKKGSTGSLPAPLPESIKTSCCASSTSASPSSPRGRSSSLTT